MRTRGGDDLLKYNYTQTNETTGDLLAEYLEDHHHPHNHSHNHHDGMISKYFEKLFF